MGGRRGWEAGLGREEEKGVVCFVAAGLGVGFELSYVEIWGRGRGDGFFFFFFSDETFFLDGKEGGG